MPQPQKVFRGEAGRTGVVGAHYRHVPAGHVVHADGRNRSPQQLRDRVVLLQARSGGDDAVHPAFHVRLRTGIGPYGATRLQVSHRRSGRRHPSRPGSQRRLRTMGLNGFCTCGPSMTGPSSPNFNRDNQTRRPEGSPSGSHA